jgi:hypothetical protein
MDASITIVITAGPFVATHEPTFCPVCQEPLRAGDPAITLDEGLGPVTVCRRCGIDRLADLLGEWRGWQG